MPTYGTEWKLTLGYSGESRTNSSSHQITIPSLGLEESMPRIPSTVCHCQLCSVERLPRSYHKFDICSTSTWCTFVPVLKPLVIEWCCTFTCSLCNCNSAVAASMTGGTQHRCPRKEFLLGGGMVRSWVVGGDL